MRVPDEGARVGDLRMPLLGCAAWAGSLAGRAGGTAAVVVVASALVLLGVLLVRRDPRVLLALAAVLLLLATGTVALLRVAEVRSGPVAELARERAVVSLQGTVATDPRPVQGRYGDLVALRLRVLDVEGRGTRHLLASPVLVLGSPAWSGVALGSRVSTTGRLAPAEDPDLAGLLVPSGAPRLVAGPGAAWRGAGRVRETIRDAVDHRPPAQRALVPALVDGDDAGLDPAVAEQFRVTGLTHLTAVSGTNLTLVVGFLLALARWVGVRGRWLPVVGAAGVVGFVLLARTEPSVLRAAVMGSVGLLAMGVNGRGRAMRALGTALIVLLLLQPPLAASAGFVLSVLATAGIVLLGPGLRDALAAWMPRVLAEAVAVPLAAQLACTPVVAAISGQVSLVAVAANLLVGPVVGPATVLGLLGGLVGLLSTAASQVLGTAAGWCVAWIVVVAQRGADLPLPAVDWGTGAPALAALTTLTVVLALLAPAVLRRRALAVSAVLGLTVVVLLRVPAGLPGLGAVPGLGPSWPPAGWVMVACDVGQGDALVLRAGPGQAVVVDAGPDADAADACLDRLGVTEVPAVVLTHFHADHVDGLPGVLRGRTGGRVLTTRVLDPPGGVERVEEAMRQQPDARAAVAPWGRTLRVGRVRLQVLWPVPGPVTTGAGDGSSANDASVVLLAEVDGVRLLLTGDVEPSSQAGLAAELAAPGAGDSLLDVDVLKVPHHGSRHQDLDWLASVRAEHAVVSVGRDNDYGHPAPQTLAGLEAGGAAVHRTDREGDLAVVALGGGGSERTRVEVVGR